jgi:hypothetical protein
LFQSLCAPRLFSLLDLVYCHRASAPPSPMRPCA